VSKRALGKGLEALFQSVSDETTSEERVGAIGLYVDIDKIIPNPNQPRKDFNPELLDELAESIREKGVLQPILVEKKGESYIIISGERRFRASVIAGLKKIPVIEKEFTEEEKYEIALIENIQRENLSPIEEAKAYQTLITSYNLGQDELSKKIGKNRSTIANSLRLLKMPQDMQDSLSSGEISAGHARAVLSVINPADQRILFNRIVTGGLSVREAEKQSSDLNNGMRSLHGTGEKKEQLQKKKSPDVMNLEQQLIDALGTKVNLNGTLAKGKIEISYFSREDLERLFDLIAK
jgi:ParB family chromosome partitioning protein